jgi:ubiquinone/menaquinone biosynthesis C-methylase UbiE
MKLSQGCCVLDAGCGYSWTTEWMMKMGLRPVGLEVSRIYLDIGRKRMGPNSQPHLIVGDTENLPFQDGVFQTVLGFDAFHHIPNRAVAMRQFCRVLKEGGRVVLVEPGANQETTPAAIEAMARFGTMEVGMELKDVQAYIDGIEEFDSAKETFLVPFTSDDGRPLVTAADLRNRDFIGWGIYSVDKRETGFRRVMTGVRDGAKAILGK